MSRRPQRQAAAQQQQNRGPAGSASGDASGEPQAVRVRLFGGFRVWVGPRAIQEDRWRLRKAKSLIKLLALSPGHRLHREQVMEILWPGLEPRAAANNLHQVLHIARRALEPAASASTSSEGARSPSSHLLLRGEQLTLCPDVPM